MENLQIIFFLVLSQILLVSSETKSEENNTILFTEEPTSFTIPIGNSFDPSNGSSITTIPSSNNNSTFSISNVEKRNISSFKDLKNTQYVAEWNLKNVENKNISDELSKITNFLFPSSRFDPGTWTDENGTWWIFGGNIEGKIFSDIWRFNLTENKWIPIFQPFQQKEQEEDSDGSSEDISQILPLSSYPEELLKPTICGDWNSGHLAAFGTPTSNTIQDDLDPIFREDNTVWLYDLPKKYQKSHQYDKEDDEVEQNETSSSSWTSFICCDACLPSDQNTTLEFCPHFGGHNSKSNSTNFSTPIIWCMKNSLMALEPLSVKNPRVDSSPKELQWWKFHLQRTEWIKIDLNESILLHEAELDSIFKSNCQNSIGDIFLYVLCSNHDDSEKFQLVVFNVHLNFVLESKIFLNVSSSELKEKVADEDDVRKFSLVVKEYKTKSIVIIFVRNLVHIWIYDHYTKNCYEKLENLWKGESLDVFQHNEGFYQIFINFQEEMSGADPENDPTEIKASFVINPRNKLFNFDQSKSYKYLVTIKNDPNVFLQFPQRNESSYFQ